jgi:hypothetical protein
VYGCQFPQLRQNPFDIEPLPKIDHGWLATAEGFRHEVEQNPEYDVHLPDATVRPANRPGKADVICAYPISRHLKALGLLNLLDDLLQVDERPGKPGCEAISQ